MILFLTGNVPDLAPDLLFNGFVELFGQDSIIDFPYAEYRHKNVNNKQQLLSQGRDLFCLTIDRYAEDRNKYSFDEIKQLINNRVFDLCIVANRALNTFIKLMDNTNNTNNTTKFPDIIMINGEDDSDGSLDYTTNLLSTTKYWEHIDLILQRDYKYTKDQNAVNGKYNEKIVPYNFSCPINILPKFDFKKDKEIDVFAQFPVTHGFRSKVIDRLKKISKVLSINTNIGYGGLSLHDYFRSMNNSKISISITGAGWDTPHYLEIPFMKSMLLAQHPINAMNPDMKETPVVYINNFEYGHSAAFYDTNLNDINLNNPDNINPNSIEELIRYYLDNDKEREQITKRGYEHVMKNLTTKNTAEYVLKSLNDNNYWRSLT